MENRFSQLAEAFLQTPPLWTHTQFGIEQFQFPEIDLSRAGPIPVESGLRLGHKMERVFLGIMGGQKTYELIDRNIAVRKDKKTMGEIDFLFRDTRDDRPVHLELTYKFYLIDTDISEPVHRLVGPNRRDMFFTKLDKLREAQFSLPFTPEGLKALEERNLEADLLTQKVCFKAQLFKPYGASRVEIRPLNNHCVAGYWLRFTDFETADFGPCHYYLPTKEEWVLNPFDKEDWISHFKVLLELNIRMLKQSSAMVWMKSQDGGMEKFFVVWW